MSTPANSETGPVTEGGLLAGEDVAHGKRLQKVAISRLKEIASLISKSSWDTSEKPVAIRVGWDPHFSHDPQEPRVLKPGEKDPGPEPQRSRRFLCVVFDDGTCAESRL